MPKHHPVLLKSALLTLLLALANAGVAQTTYSNLLVGAGGAGGAGGPSGPFTDQAATADWAPSAAAAAAAVANSATAPGQQGSAGAGIGGGLRWGQQLLRRRGSAR
jgi:hypothetical protein